MDVASGNIRQLTTRQGPDRGPVVSPDGQQVAYTGYDRTDDTYITSKIYLIHIDGSNPRLASGEWDRQSSNLIWKSDGSGLYFSSRAEGTGNLYFLPTTGPDAGTVGPVTEGDHLLTVSDLSDDGTAGGVRTSVHAPPDVVTFDIGTPHAVTQLTAVNDDILAGKTLGRVEEIWHTSTDGLRIQGWYITPPDFDPSRQYPMQLHIHGGPHGMYGVGFNYGWQWQAAQDYVILYTNPRGSAGLRQRLRERDQERLPEQGLRRPDGRRRRHARPRLRRPAKPFRHRLQRRRRIDRLGRGVTPIASPRRRPIVP